MPGQDIVVVGASAGGVEAIGKLVRVLPEDFSAAMFLVLHISSQSPSLLPEILSRAGKLQATNPGDGEAFQHGHLYIAPPDYHLLLEEGCIRLTRSAKENRHRPAINPLFRSAARTYGSRVVGVILTGAMDDGTEGLWEVKQRGGVTIVQDPADALFSNMPMSAIARVDVDHILPLSEIGPLLIRLARGQSPDQAKRIETPSAHPCLEIEEDLGHTDSVTNEELKNELY